MNTYQTYKSALFNIALVDGPLNRDEEIVLSNIISSIDQKHDYISNTAAPNTFDATLNLSSLRGLSLSERATFLNHLITVILADGKLDAQEWAYCQLILPYLSLDYNLFIQIMREVVDRRHLGISIPNRKKLILDYWSDQKVANRAI